MLQISSGDFSGFPGWRARVQPARGIATPAIQGDRVIFGGGFGSHEVYAVNARTGRQAWSLHTSDDGPTAMTLIEGVALFNTESCTLEVVDLAEGRPLWSHWLGDPLLAQPAASNGRVLMAWPAGGRHHLGAFDLRNGKPIWQTEVAADVVSAPVIVADRAWVTTYDGSVTCVDVTSGHELWTRPMKATSAPWIVGEDLYVAKHAEKAGRGHGPPRAPGRPAHPTPRSTSQRAPKERITRLRSKEGRQDRAFRSKNAAYLDRRHGEARKRSFQVQDEAVGFTQEPAAAKMHLVEGLVGERHVSRAWRFQGSRPVVVDGTLYETAGDRLEAIDLASGRLIWCWNPARAECGERRLTPPAVANGRVLIGTWDGRLLSLDAGTGEVRWQVSVHAPVHWQPVMSGGRVIAGLEDGSVVGFETGDPLDSGWPMWGGGPGHNGDSGGADGTDREEGK